MIEDWSGLYSPSYLKMDERVEGVLPFPHPLNKLLYVPRSADWLCREVERTALRGLWDSLRVWLNLTSHVVWTCIVLRFVKYCTVVSWSSISYLDVLMSYCISLLYNFHHDYEFYSVQLNKCLEMTWGRVCFWCISVRLSYFVLTLFFCTTVFNDN